MSELARQVAAAREGAVLFALDGTYARGVVAVTGRDARRWLDGMVTNDVAALDVDGSNGCYAALLTVKGRIVSDLHVLARPDGFWLETAASAVATVLERLERYIVADDVKLVDRSAELARLGIEGPRSALRLAAAAGIDAARLERVAPGGWTSVELAGAPVVAARFGWSGEDAWQLFVPARSASGVADALGLPGGGVPALEVLRIEAGIPRLGPELGEEVFPDEARLDSAISRTKGCYTGQEIVARLYSRGAVNHLLARLRFEGDRVPAARSPLHARDGAGDRKTGEVTSACLSPSQGPIGLGYVRREHAQAGTALRCLDPLGELRATVAA